MSLAPDRRQSDIFRTVFGCASGGRCQARIPMNVQAANPAEVDDGFQFLKKAFGSVGAIDLMAVAPYFDIDGDSNASTVDGIFTNLQGSVLASNPPSSNSNAIVNWLKADLAEAALYNLPLIAYEGGQGLSGSANQDNRIAAQSDPRMYDATRQYFALWDTLVGKKQLFTYYTYAAGDGAWGAWGALVSQADPGAQKWDALMSLTRTGGDANLDGTVDAADCAILRANFGKTGMWWMQGDFNHDGTVDAADLATLNANVTGAQCAAPLPSNGRIMAVPHPRLEYWMKLPKPAVGSRESVVPCLAFASGSSAKTGVGASTRDSYYGRSAAQAHRRLSPR